MKIKRLEVTGFKSFCDTTVITIDQPITAVVGPNGCGKSNIVDAIRWCMGEQSAKHLRGGAMQDVIFAGSDSRGPLGMCEVTLVFENDGNVPLEYLAYSEIAVTRKLFRDGTSEYYLNKTPCRLRDVVDFFLGTGVGAKAYSIIEQGRVGMIVSSKPEDRRFLIEEAAGITKYKLKKKQAEKKMEQTRANLLRVSDVVTEIEKQLASLRRQAQKAERYRQYKAELRDLELWTSSHRWLGFIAEERVAQAAHGDVSLRREASQVDVATREAAIETARLDAATEAERLTGLSETLYQLDNRVKLGEAEADHEEREATQLDGRRDEARAEIVLLSAQAEGDRASADGARGELAQVEAAAAGQAAALATAEERVRTAKDEQSAFSARAEQARSGKAGCLAEIARGEQSERASARRAGEVELRTSRVGEEHERLTARAAELEKEVVGHEGALDQLRQLRLDLTVERDRMSARKRELEQSLVADDATLATLTTELHRSRSRRASLEELHARYEGFARGTRAIMHEKDTRWGIRALVADVVDAPAELEPAVEAILAERLGAVVVETQEVGVSAVEFLKQANEGRASFVALTTPGDKPAAATERVAGLLAERVRVDEAYAGLADWLFGDVVLVDDLVDALDRWRAGERRTFVTLEGEVVDRHGVVTGGSREAAQAGVLAQKRELRQLESVLGDLETRHADETARVTQARAELFQLEKALETMQKDAHQGEMQLLTHDKDRTRLAGELERAQARLVILDEERAELAAQAADAAHEAEEARALLAGARDRLIGLEDELTALARDQVAALERVEAAQEALTALRVEAGQTQERRTSLVQALARLDAAQADRAARRERLEQSITDGEARALLLREQAAGRRRELLELAEERGRRAEELESGRRTHEERRAVLASGESELKGLRATLEQLGEEALALELKRHDLLGARVHLEESMAERHRVVLGEEAQAHHLRPLAGEIEELRARELKSLIERMGEINLNAIEEYNELEVRFTFLSTQKTDLEQALAQLEEAIDRINKTSRKRFREVFDLVNIKFQELFPRCFRGGQARLVLTDEDNLLESGIEIFAQPPGKKNSTVDVLSGGEKAMTAVALIFAIFLIKPSPFCLLDEVDAPLDEANVARYNDLLRELTDRTQFIVITHNKRTMQIADTLYGVTMEEPGISKLVSVNLAKLGREGQGVKTRVAGTAAA